MNPRRTLRPPLWAGVLTALAVGLFSALGAWQLRRGTGKERLLQQLASRAAPAETLSAASPAPAAGLWRRVRATGVYRADRQLLQDGQSHRRRPGYHVWTPLRIDGGALVLVDRGWVPLTVGPLEAPAGRVALQGFWRALPEPGWRLADVDNCPETRSFPAVVLYPTAQELACLLDDEVLAGLLLLDPELPGGFVREWSDFGFPPERHYGYAAQWFALAGAAIVVFVVLTVKRAR